jgi:hypothetical protein
MTDTASMSRHRCTERHEVFSSAWWSINLCPGWSAAEDGDHTVIRSHFQPGVLNISAARKPDGTITQADLREFIGEAKQGCAAPQEIKSQSYFGLTRRCVDDEISLTEWWLSRGSILVYLTYAAKAHAEDGQPDDIRRIIESLRIKGT